MSGRIFFMSDVHGQFGQFLELLKKLQFCEQDELFLLGDLVAKGPDSLGLLRFVMKHPNIRVLRGNHEQRLLRYFGLDKRGEIPDFTMRNWIAGDGAGIIGQMGKLFYEEKEEIFEFLLRLPFSDTYRVGEQIYFLVHGAPNFDKTVDYRVLTNRYPTPDAPNRLPFGHLAVVGHTPTFKYGREYAGDIIVREDKILLDCGVGQGYGLGCLELVVENGGISYRKHFAESGKKAHTEGWIDEDEEKSPGKVFTKSVNSSIL